MTIAELVELYIDEGCFVQRGYRIGQPLKPLVKKYMTSRLRHHVVPLIGNRLITELRPADIETFFRQVEKGFTRVDRKASDVPGSSSRAAPGRPSGQSATFLSSTASRSTGIGCRTIRL